MKLDDIDLKILDLLQRDGRQSHAAIGKEIGLTGPSVYARIQRLEKEGIITGYSILIDPEKIGRGLVAIVRVATVAPLDGENAFERFVQNEPQILECFDVDGEDSYILKVRTATPQSLRKLLLKLRSIPGVNHTVTSIALQTLKELPACSVEGIEVQSTEKD
jgi:Lrp/AsnC family leucine-responsive transcriptional regulator